MEGDRNQQVPTVRREVPVESPGKSLRQGRGEPRLAAELIVAQHFAKVPFIQSPRSSPFERRRPAAASATGISRVEQIAGNRNPAAVAEGASNRLKRVQAARAQRDPIGIGGPDPAKPAFLREEEVPHTETDKLPQSHPQ